jgi:hypothetical protein
MFPSRRTGVLGVAPATSLIKHQVSLTQSTASSTIAWLKWPSPWVITGGRGPLALAALRSLVLSGIV